MKALILLLSLMFSFQYLEAQGYQQYVNPLIGTDVRVVVGKDKHSTEERGQNMPAVGVPHGMTNWVAQTQATEQKCHPPYYFFHDSIQGFRASHWMNGSCTQDYGSVTIMPLQGLLKTNPKARASSFLHSKEKVSPSCYEVELQDYNINAAVTGLSRSAIMNFDFKDDGDHFIIIEPNSDEGVATIEIDPANNEIRGSNPVHRIYQGFGQPTGFSGHFVIKIDSEIESYGTWENDKIMTASKSAQGFKTNVGAWIKLKSKRPVVTSLSIGTSFTSIDNAKKNMISEVGTKRFEEVRAESAAIWNKALGQIVVKGDNRDDKIKFYTALYNVHFLPRAFSDVDGSYPQFDGGKEILKMQRGDYYCDFSQWDTYRAVHPLFTILNPNRDGDMAHSLVLKGQQGGWLPIFPSWNSYTAAMIGDHCSAMLGDAIMKDIPGFDYEEAYALMRKNAFEINTDSVSYRDGKGRRALASYLKYGYIPLEDEVLDAFHKREQVSRTLEYAYDDYVVAQVANKLGKKDDYEKLLNRSKNYKNVIDTETGFARGRHDDGSWITPFDPYKMASFICEGTPFHYTWYVPQDPEGLMQQMGGKERFINRLDTLFEGEYYWHGNEPGHHIVYLFALGRTPWKTQKWVHHILDTEYFTTPDGLSGNDDAGQMSAWQIFSMMGFYPVCPGNPEYVIGSPSFEHIAIKLENGKEFVIDAHNFSSENIYIKSATLNGVPLNKPILKHKDIMDGGYLKFEMDKVPNKSWGI